MFLLPLFLCPQPLCSRSFHVSALLFYLLRLLTDNLLSPPFPVTCLQCLSASMFLICFRRLCCFVLPCCGLSLPRVVIVPLSSILLRQTPVRFVFAFSARSIHDELVYSPSSTSLDVTLHLSPHTHTRNNDQQQIPSLFLLCVVPLSLSLLSTLSPVMLLTLALSRSFRSSREHVVRASQDELNTCHAPSPFARQAGRAGHPECWWHCSPDKTQDAS